MLGDNRSTTKTRLALKVMKIFKPAGLRRLCLLCSSRRGRKVIYKDISIKISSIKLKIRVIKFNIRAVLYSQYK